MSGRGNEEVQSGIEWIPNAPYARELVIVVPLMAVAVTLLSLGAYLTLEPAFITRAIIVAAALIILAYSVALIARGLKRPHAIGFFSKGFALRSRQGRVRSFLWTELEDVTLRRSLGVACADVRYRDQRPADSLVCGQAANELASRFLRRP